MKKIKVLLADDHEMILDGFKLILKEDEQIEVVGTATNGKDAYKLIQELEVDVAVLDIRMPLLTGIEITKLLQEQASETKVLILSMHDTMEYIDELIDTGCVGYILKNKGREELVTAIHRVYHGKTFLGQRIQDRIMEQRMAAPKKTNEKALPDLTSREVQVLQLIVDGLTSPEISEKLHIVESTVNTHRRNLINKLDVKNSSHLISFALRNKLVE